jgi:hypothetical protein
MILDQTVGSARAERKNRVRGRVIRNLMTALLASVLTLPSLAAWGMESSPKWPAAPKPGDLLPLPPIRYLDSMPWMKWSAPAPTLRIDTLMSPSVTPGGVLQTPGDGAKSSPTLS